jgi:hypothetical protein
MVLLDHHPKNVSNPEQRFTYEISDQKDWSRAKAAK